jgi:alkaline phosphatase
MSYIINRRQFLKYSGAGMLALSVNGLRAFARQPLLTFGIVTDSHYADREVLGMRHYRDSIAKMEEAMNEMNSKKVDFVVHLGDFKDQAEHPDERSTLAFLERIEQAFASFRGPRYHVLGNHDTDSISKQQFLQHVENTGIAKDQSFYSLDQKGVHFVVLDGDFTKEGVAYEKGNFDWTDSFIPEEQLTWLTNDLRATRLPVIVFVHQLLDNVDDPKYCVHNAEAVRSVLDESGKVRAVFQGHRHKDRYNKLKDVHYCTLPAMVDYSGLENNSFSIVEVYDNGLNMVGYKRAPSREIGKL